MFGRDSDVGRGVGRLDGERREASDIQVCSIRGCRPGMTVDGLGRSWGILYDWSGGRYLASCA